MYEELDKASKKVTRAKDKKMLDLQKAADRVQPLEARIRELEKENSAMGISWKELSDVLVR